MAEPQVLPPNMVVRDMLQDMLGRDVQVSPADPWTPTPQRKAAVAVYVNDSVRLSAVIAIDMPLAASLSASIALIPAKTAEEIAVEGELPDDMVENLNEVLNILGGMFNRKHSPHVRLFQLHAPGFPPPTDISAALRRLGNRSDLRVSVNGYGSGLLSIVLA